MVTDRSIKVERVGGLIVAGLKNSQIKGYAGWERENYETRERREKANQAAIKHFRAFRS